MAKLSYKASYYIFYVLIALVLLVLGLFFGVGYTNPMGDYNAPEHTETLIFFMYFMFGFCVLATLLGAIAQFGAALRDNPKGAIKSLMGLILLVIVLVVTYGAASTDPIVMADGTSFTDVSMLKLSDMLLYSTYFLFTVAAVATLVNLSGIFKK
ncbi:hypothetical protein, membrane [gut metagenome]|uniref:Uncharacterized protein n=1 Tax=gut metagenome TaxID=749906 RepID=J9GVK0_9ZZZZ